MKTSKFPLSLSLFGLCSLLFFGCVGELNQVTPEINPAGTHLINQRGLGTDEWHLPMSDDYLTFKDFKSFREAAVEANNSATDNRLSGPTKPGFVSLKWLFEAEIKNFAERELPALLNAPSTGSEALVNEVVSRTQRRIFTNYQGLISYDAENAFQLQVYPGSYAPLLNRYGVVKIGEDLYQFALGYMKVIRGGDATKIPALFSTFVTDQAKGIEVTRIRINSQTSTQNAGRTFQEQVANCRNTVGNFRVLVYEDLYQVPSPNGGFELEVTLQSRSRANLIWQNWPTQDLEANGQAQFFGGPTIDWVIPKNNVTALSERIAVVAGVNSASACPSASCLRSRTNGFGPGGTTCFTRAF